MELVSLIDFGSTFTKVAIVDLDSEQMLARAQSVSTVAENIMDGLRNALSKLQMSKKAPWNVNATRKLACSSAAGGLRILVAGLVPELTVEAAKRTAFGAGAKVVASYSYELNDDDMRTGTTNGGRSVPGFCTPGMIMSAKALLDENPNPADEEIRRAIAGNFCRCTGYTKIFESIKTAAKSTTKE